VTRPTALAVLVLAVLHAAAPFAGAPTVLGPWAETVSRVIVLAALLAGMIALHQAGSRYLVALARDRRPSTASSGTGGLGTARPGTGSPGPGPVPGGPGLGAASLVQTFLMGLVLCALVAVGPLSGVPAWVGPAGGIGVLLLLTAASLAALIHLNRAPNGESFGQRFLAPAVATVGLGALSYLALVNLGPLGLPTRIVPIAFGVALLLGLLYGLILRTTNPIAYAGLALGGTAVVVTPAAVPIPKPRTPGAHRPERLTRS
jgi:hypothetical protein